MSMGEKGICVRILEKEFRVGCEASQETALRDAAQYLDKQMRLIRQTGRVIGMERIAVMAALNIANELLKLKNDPTASGEIFFERIKVLQEKIDGALASSPVTLKESDILLENKMEEQMEEEVDEEAQTEMTV